MISPLLAAFPQALENPFLRTGMPATEGDLKGLLWEGENRQNWHALPHYVSIGSCPQLLSHMHDTFFWCLSTCRWLDIVTKTFTIMTIKYIVFTHFIFQKNTHRPPIEYKYIYNKVRVWLSVWPPSLEHTKQKSWQQYPERNRLKYLTVRIALQTLSHYIATQEQCHNKLQTLLLVDI